MSSANRPYVGTYQVNRSLVRHTPDAIVFINGAQEFAVCPSCNKRLDVNKYITQLSVDASTDSISSANLTLSIPRHETDVFSHDGNYILQPNLEVVIFMRGYFPMKDFGGMGQDPSNEDGFDADNVPLYPYYQVFRGVVTNVTHDYSGGFYNATLQAANLLHFWQNLKLSVNGSVFGRRPSGSMVEPSLVGHKFTGANPYAIIYTLVKVGFGAAFGVDFNYSQSSNIRATDDDGRQSLYAHAAQWWEKRWTEHSGNLRMYGIDGTIFNAFQQAYLGSWFDTRDKSSGAFHVTAKQVYAALKGSSDYNPDRGEPLLRKARELGYDPYLINAAVYDTSSQSSSSGGAGAGRSFATEDILRMQAFTLDIGKMGAVNLFETEYMSKLEIAEAVKALTGYEFYQDVDGDLVFKPPMYNMDTRDDPVYRISDRDLISISETETEPEATMMKGTGSHFSNITGHGVDGWLGVGAVYIDYRLVAKYGYKEETFETNYLSARQAIFVSAMNRLDLANAGVKSASISIPLRPEMRPGYPCYIEHLDCFYYVKSLSHSLQFGGQGTTTINGVAKRAKWFPPMQAVADGAMPAMSDIKLDSPDEFPKMPMYAYPQYLTGDDATTLDAESSGPPRIIGFPNVVLALDPDKINLDTVDLDSGALTADAYVSIALASGFLERGDEPDTFWLRSSNEGKEVVQLADIQQEWADVAEALGAGSYDPNAPENSGTTLGKIIQAVYRRTGGIDTPNSQGLINFLSLQTSLKSVFSPGSTISGKYRYYSCSHPDVAHQGPTNLLVDQEAGEISTTDPGKPDESFTGSVVGLANVGSGKGMKSETREVTRGIRIASYSQNGDDDVIATAAGGTGIKTEVVRTADIRFVTFGPQVTRKRYRVSYVDSGRSQGWNFRLDETETRDAFSSLMRTRVIGTGADTISERLSTEYNRLWAAITNYSIALSSVGATGATGSKVSSTSSRTATVSKALDNYSRLPDGSADKPFLGADGVFNSKPEPAAIETIVRVLARALWAFVRIVTTSTINSAAFGDEKYAVFMDARSDYIFEYTDKGAIPPDSDPSKTFFFAEEYKETPDWTPIFPVSDASGYEVYGNLPYGRGVTIEKYAELLQSTTTGENTESGAEAAETSTTLVGTTGGSNASSLVAIEKFFAAYLLTDDASEIFSSNLLTSIEKAALEAAFNTDVEGIQDAVETLFSQETSQQAKIRNTPVTSFFRGQSVTGDVAAANLANLDVGGEFCFCKGADAAYFIQAFSEEYVDLYDDPVQGYQEETTHNLGESWKISRDAMAGTSGTRTNLAEEFTSQGDLANSYSNAAASVTAAAQEAAAAAAAATERLLSGDD